MEFPRKIGKTVVMSSSEESTSSIFLGYHNLILQDPRINLKLPKFLLIGTDDIKVNIPPTGLIHIHSMQRGLALIRVLANLNDVELTEWKHATKVVTDSLSNLKPLVKNEINSTERWVHIVQYMSRSRRFISWLKIMRAIPVLVDEFPMLRRESKKLFDVIKDLLVGKTPIARRNLGKWEEEMRKIPTKF